MHNFAGRVSSFLAVMTGGDGSGGEDVATTTTSSSGSFVSLFVSLIASTRSFSSLIVALAYEHLSRFKYNLSTFVQQEHVYKIYKWDK
jgi:hypothetical protein